jgi:PAS domain S-box-containing protein
MKFLLEKRISLFYFLLAAALVSILLFFYYNNKKVKAASDLVEHTQEVLRTSDCVLLDILDIETGSRGYALTGNEIFLEPFNKGVASIKSNLSKLALLVIDNPKQHLRIDSLKNTADERLVLINRMIDTRRQNKLNEAEKIFIVGKGKILTDKIRSIISIVNAEEFGLLNKRKTEIEKNNTNSELIFLLLLIFIILIFVLIFIIVRNQKIRNVELEEFNSSKKLLSNYSLSLIEASLDPLITLNTEGKITDMNEALVNITGVKREKLTGTDFFNYFTEPQKAREVYQEVFANGSVADLPLTLRHKNGKLTDVLFNGSVYKDDQGNVLGIVIVARDVTAQKLLSKYSLSLIEASLDPLITINAEGKITDMNEALANITGLTREELTETDFFDYFTEPQKAREVYLEVFAEGSVADSPLTLRHKDGKLTDVLFNGSVYKDDRGNVLGAVVVARDIAEQKWATELRVVNKELAYQNKEKENRAAELFIANKELVFQNDEKGKRADELSIANDELAFQNKEKEKRAAELGIANVELAFQNNEKEKRAAELFIANKELLFQNDEKEKRADELSIANDELAYQNKEKENRAAELVLANDELAYQNQEKEKRAAELFLANKELVFQNEEKEKRAAELILANKELVFQNEEKEKRAAELFIANKELVFQNQEKEKRAAELILANKELVYQNQEKIKRAAELVITDKELIYQTREKEKQEIANVELEAISDSLKLASQYSLSLIEASRDPLVTINIEGKITDMNEALVNITGITRKELTGTDFFDYFTEPQMAREVYQEVFAKGSVADSPLTLRHKDGKLTDVLFNGSVYKDDNGNVLGVVIVARDVTAQKLASQYARSLIEASLDPLFTINPAGKITDMNEASVNITGVSHDKLVGTDFFDYFTEPQKAREVYQEVFANGYVADYPLKMKDERLTDVLLNGSVYTDDRGNVLGVVVVARDITDQKRIETELIEAKVFAELATLIAEEAKGKAESATAIAENAVKAKQQFLSNMSHEIRTPMNAIIGFTKVVLKTELTTKQKEYLSAIKISGDALIVLINDILDLAKVDAGKMVFQQTPFKMALSISAMLHLFETKIQEKNLLLVKQYDPNIPDVLVGDPVRLHQIILNLVSNAVKFTTTGKITVSVRLLTEDEEKVTIEFSVTDTGIGIPEDKIGKIFENFQQASSGTSRLYGGTGLGLAIVKQLVEPQGGSINVKSIINEGSTFSFILNFMKTSEDAEIESEIEEMDTEIKSIKVLVAEDIPLNQLLMKTLLDDFGFEREIASNGKIAIEKLKANTYDIILMDLQMPEMNGFEATEYIRNEMNSTIPIIALTADVTTVDLAKCRAVGMNDYIAKPVDERLLYNKIVGLVKKPTLIKYNDQDGDQITESKKSRCIDLDYLIRRTKSNPDLMMQMISLYLEQTPPLISAMKQSFHDKNWTLLYSAVHKMIPSFSIMGISSDFENMAKKVQEFASTQKQTDGINDMVLQLGNVCNQACRELEEELLELKEHNHE